MSIEEHVVGDWRTVATVDDSRGQIEANRFVVIEPGRSEPTQRGQVDVDIVEPVVSRDQSGQHARIGRVNVTGDHRDAEAGHTVHAKTLQDDDVAVPTADEHEILEHRRGRVVHR